MIIYNKWEIVLVPFPFTDFSSSKKRPALIVSPQEYNVMNDYVIAFITSNIEVEKRYCDYLIQNWKKANLPKPSLIRMKFSTIDSNIIIKKIGKLTEPDILEFQNSLRIFFS